LNEATCCNANCQSSAAISANRCGQRDLLEQCGVSFCLVENYRDIDTTRYKYNANIVIFDTMRYIVPTLIWTICKSFAPRSKQITILVPHHSVFTAWMPFLPPNQQSQSTEDIHSLHSEVTSKCEVLSFNNNASKLLTLYSNGTLNVLFLWQGWQPLPLAAVVRVPARGADAARPREPLVLSASGVHARVAPVIRHAPRQLSQHHKPFAHVVHSPI